jgi:hypothetical protein
MNDEKALHLERTIAGLRTANGNLRREIALLRAKVADLENERDAHEDHAHALALDRDEARAEVADLRARRAAQDKETLMLTHEEHERLQALIRGEGPPIPKSLIDLLRADHPELLRAAHPLPPERGQ